MSIIYLTYTMTVQIPKPNSRNQRSGANQSTENAEKMTFEIDEVEALQAEVKQINSEFL